MFKPKRIIQKKRQFVTIKDINRDKEMMINSRKKIQANSTVVSPTKGGVGFSRLPPEEFQSIKNGTIGLGDYVKLFEKPAENENLVEGGSEVTGGKVNEYEMRRNKNVEENKRKLEALELKRRPGNSVQQKNSRSKTLSNEAGSEYRCPENEEDRESNVEEDIVSSKRKKKGKRVPVRTDGPTTRSRASKISRPSDKQVSTVEFCKFENDASEVPIVEKLKLLKNNAPGSMVAYLQLREQEKHAEMEILQS